MGTAMKHGAWVVMMALGASFSGAGCALEAGSAADGEPQEVLGQVSALQTGFATDAACRAAYASENTVVNDGVLTNPCSSAAGWHPRSTVTTEVTCKQVNGLWHPDRRVRRTRTFEISTVSWTQSETLHSNGCIAHVRVTKDDYVIDRTCEPDSLYVPWTLSWRRKETGATAVVPTITYRTVPQVAFMVPVLTEGSGRVTSNMGITTSLRPFRCGAAMSPGIEQQSPYVIAASDAWDTTTAPPPPPAPETSPGTTPAPR